MLRRRGLGMGAIGLLIAGLCALGHAAEVRVSVSGRVVPASAQREGTAVVCRLLPILSALGGEVVYLKDGPRLSVRAPDGTRIEVVAGRKQFTVNGQPRDAEAEFRATDGDLIGPVADPAQAMGATVRFDRKAGELRLAHRVTQVETHAADEAALIHIRLSGPGTGELRLLDDPPRAYVDFAGLAWEGANEALEVGGAGGLRRVRWALLQEWPPVSRVVVDLEPGARARLSQVADRIFVVAVLPKAASSAAPASPPPKAHVLIDPAAGGTDAGVRGRNSDEKTVALDVAIRLAVRLMEAGVLVAMTRDGDATVTPEERARRAKSAGAGLVVRISCAADRSRSACGVRTRYPTDGSAPFAAALQAALVKKLGAKDRGTVKVADASLPPTVVAADCSVGFLTCPDEERRLTSPNHREDIAAALAGGIAAYLARKH